MDGKRYIDAISSWWVNLFGHSNKFISAAVSEQAHCLEHVILAGVTHEPAVRLAEKLVAITPPGLDRVFFADSGSSAVEISLKMSFHYWRNTGVEGRNRFVTLSNSYHGDTLGALGVGDAGLFKEAYQPLLMEPIVAPSPDCFALPRDQWDAHASLRLAELRQLLVQHRDEICAMIIEPLIQCAGGMRMYPPSYLTGLRQLCDEFNIHLIADEIAVGFGRAGSMFACEQGEISPDFMCLSKGLTGGYLPMSAVMTSNKVYEAFYDEYTSLRGFLHSHSYTGNALACAAALATMELFEARDVLADNRVLAQQMMDAISPLHEHPHIGDIRQTGMVLAMEMVAQREPMIQYDWKERRGMKVLQYGLQHGVLLRPIGNTVYFMPPYIIQEDEIAQMAKAAMGGIDLATAD
jgi:adenosylmethionine-8-amino-7-oxononanoate aminotransferase